MQRMIVSAALGLLALVFTSTAQAHHGGMSVGMNSSFRPGFVQASHFQGINRHNSLVGPIRTSSRSWCSRSCWSSRYGCNCYYHPGYSCWYYWCQSQRRYYPLSYINQYPPTATGPVAGMQPVGGFPGGLGGQPGMPGVP